MTTNIQYYTIIYIGYIHNYVHDLSVLCFCTGTPGKIVVISSRLPDIKVAQLNLIDRATGSIHTTLNLTPCSGSLVSDPIVFPPGEFSYQLVGRDTNDIGFSYDTRTNVIFTYNRNYTGLFSIKGPSLVEMDPYEIVTLTYTLHNNALYSAQFRLSAERISGFATLLRTPEVRVPASGIAEIEVLVRRTSSSIRRGTSHSLTITASNDCFMVATSTTLQIKELVCKYKSNFLFEDNSMIIGL